MSYILFQSHINDLSCKNKTVDLHNVSAMTLASLDVARLEPNALSEPNEVWKAGDLY